LAGDSLTCLLSISRGYESEDILNIYGDICIVGAYIVDPSWAQLPNQIIDHKKASIYNIIRKEIGDYSRCIFISDIAVIRGFKYNELPKSYIFQSKLPTTLPPSFRGVALKYVYMVLVNITIDYKVVSFLSTSTQSITKTMRLPFRVINSNCGKEQLHTLIDICIRFWFSTKDKYFHIYN